MYGNLPPWLSGVGLPIHPLSLMKVNLAAGTEVSSSASHHSGIYALNWENYMVHTHKMAKCANGQQTKFQLYIYPIK